MRGKRQGAWACSTGDPGLVCCGDDIAQIPVAHVVAVPSVGAGLNQPVPDLSKNTAHDW